MEDKEIVLVLKWRIHSVIFKREFTGVIYLGGGLAHCSLINWSWATVHHHPPTSPQGSPVDRQPCCRSGGLHGPGSPSLRWSLPAAFWLSWCLKVNLHDGLQIHGCSSRLEREERDLYARPAGVCHHSEPLCHLFILVIQQHMAEWLLIGHPFKVIEPVYAKEMYVSVEINSENKQKLCCLLWSKLWL